MKKTRVSSPVNENSSFHNEKSKISSEIFVTDVKETSPKCKKFILVFINLVTLLSIMLSVYLLTPYIYYFIMTLFNPI